VGESAGPLTARAVQILGEARVATPAPVRWAGPSGA